MSHNTQSLFIHLPLITSKLIFPIHNFTNSRANHEIRKCTLTIKTMKANENIIFKNSMLLERDDSKTVKIKYDNERITSLPPD